MGKRKKNKRIRAEIEKKTKYVSVYVSRDGGGVDVLTAARAEGTASLPTNAGYIHMHIMSVHMLHLLVTQVEEASSHLAPQAPVLCPGWLVVCVQDSTAWYMNG